MPLLKTEKRVVTTVAFAQIHQLAAYRPEAAPELQIEAPALPRVLHGSR